MKLYSVNTIDRGSHIYGKPQSGSSTIAAAMDSPVGATATSGSEHRPAVSKGTMVFSYTCVSLTGATLLSILFFYCYHFTRSRAPVTAAESAESGPDDHRVVSVDVAKLPEFAYTRSARHSGGGGDGAQCSVCLGAVQVGEMVRTLPVCKHLYHVECIDMWLASHATCPLCRSAVAPLGDGQPAPSMELPQALAV